MDIDDKDLDAYHVFAKQDNKIIACLRILKRGVTYPEITIGRLVCAKEQRRKGISSVAMTKAI